MESIIQPTALPRNNYIASQVTLNFIAACVIGVRLGANWSHHKKFFADDYICVVGLIFVAGFSVISSMLASALNSSPDRISIQYLTTLANATIFMATSAMYLAKLPILIFLIRAFGIKKWLRYIAYFLMVFTALGFLAAALETGVNCSSSSHDDLGDAFLFNCMLATFYTGVSRNSLSVAVDLVIIVLPLPIISKLELPIRKKVGLAIVFLVGSFGIIAGVISLYYQVNAGRATSTNVVNAMLATSIECCSILIVSCAAALRVFWTNNLKKSPLFVRLGLDGTYPTSHSKISRVPRSKRYQYQSNDSTNPIKVTSHHYIEFGDFPKTTITSYEATAGRGQSQEEV